MEEKIKDAFRSELPYLGKGLLFISLCIFAYVAGIISYDIISGKEIDYFTEIRDQIEEKLAHNTPKISPIAKPTPRPEGFPEPTVRPQPDVTHTLTNSQGYELRQPNEDYPQFSNLFINNEAVYVTGDFELSVSKVVDFWYDDQTKTLYTIETKDVPASHQEGINNQLYIAYDLSGKAPVPITVLYNDIPGIWSGTRYLDFIDEKLLVLTKGGDGCGGAGSVWLLSESGKKIITEFGSGCAPANLPRYIDYLGDGAFLFFDRSPGALYETSSNTIEEFYTLDASGNRKVLITKDSFPESLYYQLSTEPQGYVFSHLEFDGDYIQKHGQTRYYFLSKKDYSLSEYDLILE